ncbi:MAG: PAS domain-containing protein [Candidatus Magnetobacterium sp. LHC-1]|uniref:PAS domain-containing protein n=1 Tax=Candidatus Magnetobacterium casense TaxID=1455061 RepID=A0ABS6RWA3_9BACT|nr:PAS domain-containing protein [Candidatus Magnetobacterium casensis]MBF0606005.1 PAS domain-containing protein [Nitrospirota bacterium]MBV6340907.1 PAS domain-containing protein [Candidatus Magnetobacterium casensis]
MSHGGDKHLTSSRFKTLSDYLFGILDCIPDKVYIIDADDYSVLWANRTASPHGEHFGMKCCDLIQNRHGSCCSDDHICLMEKVKKTRRTAMFENICQGENGSEGVYEVQVHPIFDEEGDIIQFLQLRRRKSGVCPSSNIDKRVAHPCIKTTCSTICKNGLL